MKKIDAVYLDLEKMKARLRHRSRYLNVKRFHFRSLKMKLAHASMTALTQ